MLTIRMLVDRTAPLRLAGRLYRMAECDARPLVESGFAAWEYVPEPKAISLIASEPEQSVAPAPCINGEGDE